MALTGRNLRLTRAYAPALLASLLLGLVCARAILASAGEPAAPLDDAFIHLQYARRIAEGSFFSYVRGEGYTTGATSLLWPLVLAPFHALGVRGSSLLYVTWLFGTAAHAALAVETARLARRLAGRAAGLGAGAMCLVFGAFAWFAWSGMETVPLAWILMRTARAAAAYCEPEDTAAARASSGGLAGASSGNAGPVEVALLGFAAPLVRPEGAIASVIAAVALGARPRGGRWKSRLLALVPLAGPLFVPALHLAFAGHAASATAMVKWYPLNPYYAGAGLREVVLSNVKLLLTNLIDGGEWTTIFLPEGSALPILLGAVALLLAAGRRRLPFHGLFVALVALGTLLPCTYLSFLWNRVRYIWPFAGAWFVLVACLARELGDLCRRVYPRAAHVTPLLCGLCVGALATKLPWTVRDLAQSARAIDLQQVALGRWAAEHLPRGARIGVNDTGAIAYFSERPTFDVVGLTTEGEARYWVAGAGSRYEHYEKLPREKLPTHFIVYPQWMACPPVLGSELFEATVTDQSILGGNTMVVYEANYATLGSGARPALAGPFGALADELDVADLESEAAHGYALEAGAGDQDNQAALLPAPRGAAGSGEGDEPMISDGGRLHRHRDAWRAQLGSKGATRLVMRVGADEPVELSVALDGREVGRVSVPSGLWVERSLDLPEARGEVEVEVSGGGRRFHSFHYWFFRR